MLAQSRGPELYLGGGNALSWPGLFALLAEPPSETAIWVELPVEQLDADRLAAAAAQGLCGVLLQSGVEAAEPLSEGIDAAEALGLEVRLRLCAEGPAALAALELCRLHAPRPTWLELSGAPPDLQAFDEAFAGLDHVEFSAHRLQRGGYLPPCVLPRSFGARPSAWRATFAGRAAPNAALDACAGCGVADRCQWDDAALRAEFGARAMALPVASSVTVHRPHRPGPRPSPVPGAELVCTAAWTTLEVVSPDGDATQCCSDWTHGTRGDPRTQSLSEIWNGEGFRSARRVLASADTRSLCKPICPRLHDKKLATSRFEFFPGAPAFEENQRLVADDIAERREVMRGRPLSLTLAPSSYCNYDCVMCDHGRTPRRDLPASVLEEVVDFLPTLRILNLLGGEPLADARVMALLRGMDRRKTPDVGIALTTNGSLLTERALSHLTQCPFADVTVSLNAATPETYARVHRGLDFGALLANLDALTAFRDRAPQHFAITLSFVVMPDNAAELPAFGELARARGLPIRLLPVSGGHLGPEIDFYADRDRVAAVLAPLDALRGQAEQSQPAWLREIDGTRSAIVAEAARREAGARRLPVLS